MDNYELLVPTEMEARYFADYGLAARICGVGMAECAAVTADVLVGQRPDLLILAGIAGAYAGDLALGETVVVQSERVADLQPARFQKTYTEPLPAAIPCAFRAVASNTVNSAGSVPFDAAQAAIENMEGAAFFAVCQQFSTPCLEVRTISNRVGEPVTAAGLEMAARNLAQHLASILSALESPAAHRP